METQKNLIRLLLLCLVLTAARARLSPAPSPSDSPLSSISEPPVEADLSPLPPSTPTEELSPDWLSDQPAHSNDLPLTIPKASHSDKNPPKAEADLSPLPPSTPTEDLSSPDWLSDQPAHSDDLPLTIPKASEKLPPKAEADLPTSTPTEELSPDWLSDQPAHSNDLPSTIFSTSLLSMGPNPIISKICDNTDHPPLCLATVLPFAKGEKSIDVQSVLKFAVEASSLYAKAALSETKKLASKPGTPEELKATLKDCKNSYETAVENFAKTADAFSTNDVGTMRSVLSAVITFVGDCEDEFAQMQTQSPLSGYAEKLTDMTSNCLAIVSQMMN